MNVLEYKPDCGYAWMVVAACFCINFIMAGLQRAAGVLYIALIDDYVVSREIATAPFSLRFCVRNLSGPLVGALGQRFGVRPVVLLGGLISGIGGIMCSIAPNVTWITISWGAVHGLGYGMSNIIHVIILNRYFQKYKCLALGICLTGDCFGTFLLPVLLEFLLKVYGLKGTFLILAGISLNVVPAALILKSPQWERKEENPKLPRRKKEEKNVKCLNNYSIDNEAFAYSEDFSVCNASYTNQHSIPEIILYDAVICDKINEKDVYSPKSCGSNTLDAIQVTGNGYLEIYNNTNFMNKFELNLKETSSLRFFDKMRKCRNNLFNFTANNIQRKNSNISVLSCPTFVGKPSVESLCKSIIKDQLFLPPSSPLQINDYLESSSSIDKSLESAKQSSTALNPSTLQKLSTSSEIKQKDVLYNGLIDKECSNIINLEKASKASCDRISTKPVQEKALKQFIKTNFKPIFLLICSNMALYVFLFISIFTIIIDYASDNNIPSEYGKYLIIAFSVTDVFGRIGFGWVLDKQWIGYGYYAGLTTGLMGLFIFIIPFSKSFIFWMTSFSLCGFIQGGVSIMYPILVEHYMEKDEETVALGSLNFYGGLLMLPVPPMIGFFRDAVGSYDGVFWTTGGLCIFAGSLWLLEPLFVRSQRNKTAHITNGGEKP